MRALSLLSLLIIGVCIVNASLYVDDTGFFRDEYGRARLYHGVNVVYKEAPFIPITDSFDVQSSLNDDDIRNLREWGMNVVRLGVMWPAVEPSPQQYNATYIDQMNELINRLGSYGVYTIVDFHQDLLHPSMCGEGLPDHALKVSMTTCSDDFLADVAKIIGVCKGLHDYNLTYDSNTGYPTVDSCLKHNFAFFYASPDVSSAFQNFYNDPDIVQSFLNYWAYLAKSFSNNDYVIGYDLFNEPWVGNPYEHPELLIPGNADKHHLQPLYDAVFNVINQYDTKHIIFYEPVPIPDYLGILGGSVYPIGFDHAPGESAGKGRQALSYHIYCTQSGAGTDSVGDIKPEYNKQCDRWNSECVRKRVEDAARLKSGTFITEMGACTNTDQCLLEIERTANAADNYLQSWAYWQLKYYYDVTTTSGVLEGFYDQNGNLQEAKVKALARTYAQAIAGDPNFAYFSSPTAAFTLSYTYRSTSTAPTLVYFNPKFYYPNGHHIYLSPASDMFAFLYDDTHIAISHDERLPDNATVHFAVVPKGSISTTFISADNDELLVVVDDLSPPSMVIPGDKESGDNDNDNNTNTHNNNNDDDDDDDDESEDKPRQENQNQPPISDDDDDDDDDDNRIDVPNGDDDIGKDDDKDDDDDNDDDNDTDDDNDDDDDDDDEEEDDDDIPGPLPPPPPTPTPTPPKTTISLATNPLITWFKGIRVLNYDNEVLCDISTQDSNHGPVSCDIPIGKVWSLQYGYRIELWKAKVLGIHKLIDTITETYLGPLINRHITFTWNKDS